MICDVGVVRVKWEFKGMYLLTRIEAGSFEEVDSRCKWMVAAGGKGVGVGGWGLGVGGWGMGLGWKSLAERTVLKR